jgi:hypothetical protein
MQMPALEAEAAFDAAVRWARGYFGISAPVTDYQAWRGQPMESVMRVAYHSAQVTKTWLAGRFEMSSSCTAATNASLPPRDEEKKVVLAIMAGESIEARCPHCGAPMGEPDLDVFG